MTPTYVNFAPFSEGANWGLPGAKNCRFLRVKCEFLDVGPIHDTVIQNFKKKSYARQRTVVGEWSKNDRVCGECGELDT